MTLSSLLVQRQVASMRQVEEALARQVIYGGDLTTNLIEVARVDEALLTTLLAEQYGIPPAPLGPLPPPTEHARKLVGHDAAVERSVVPLAVEGDRVVLAVGEPLGAPLLDELGGVWGLPVDQRVTLPARIRQALASYYGVGLDRRLQRIVAKLDGVAMPTVLPPPGASLLPPPESGPPVFSPPPAQATHHVATLQELPAVGRAPTELLPPRRNTVRGLPSPAVQEGMPGPAVPDAEPTEPQGLPPAAESSSSEITARLSRDLQVGRETRDTIVALDPPSSSPFAAGHPSSSRLVPKALVKLLRQEGQAARAPRRRRGPMTLDMATKELDPLETRDALLELFFDFARQFFDYSALFVVHGELAEGREAHGPGASPERIATIGAPLDHPSLLATARRQQATVIDRPVSTGLDGVLLADMGRPVGPPVLVTPVVVRGRTVALLYADNGANGVDAQGAADVVAFCGIVGRTFEQLIVRKKLGLPPGSVPRVRSGQPLHAPRMTEPAGPPSMGELRAFQSILRGPDAPSTGEGRGERLSDAPPPSNPAWAPRASSPPPPAVSGAMPAVSELRAPSSVRPAVVASSRASSPPPSVPPPANAVVMRRPSGPPIPREEPVEAPPTSARGVLGHTDVYDELVESLLARGQDDALEAELVRRGHHAMPALMARFPGPIVLDPNRGKDAPPRVTECGPLLRVIAKQRKVAVPFVLALLDDPDEERRYWATFLLTELPFPEAIGPFVSRLHDRTPRIQRAARLAARVLYRAAPDVFVEALARSASAGARFGGEQRALLIATLVELRAQAAVPNLLALLTDPEPYVHKAAHKGLIILTRQDFGREPDTWRAWWSVHAGEHRIEWLIDSLMHERLELRREAAAELKSITKEYFGYAEELPDRERVRAQQRYRDWWETEGRLRFVAL